VKCNFRPNTAIFDPSLGVGLETTYDVHLRLIEKLVVDFLLVLIKFFCYVLRLFSLQQGQFGGWPKISGKRGRLPGTILVVRKLG